MAIDEQMQESSIGADTPYSLTETHAGLLPAVASDIRFPAGWYYFGSVPELQRGPVARDIVGQRLVGFLTETGEAGVLSRQCVHMGADLVSGCVVGESLQCSLHNWRFRPDGSCVDIPATDSIPLFARQVGYPTAVRNQCVYFFNGQVAAYPLPFFDGFAPDDLVAAKPFVEYLDCPWYMVGANAVDVQHFVVAHDRQMTQRPQVDYPQPHIHRTVCHFDIVGRSLSDRLTKRFGGSHVKLEITDWGSSMIFARSTLARTETFGMLSIVPLPDNRCMGHVTVMARQGSGVIARGLLDPLRAGIRRLLIRTFLRSDVGRLAGTRYSPHTLIDIDDQFADYFRWLKGLSNAS